jgi:3-oxoacyl-[acyl-carrier-protein] synthase II
MGRERDDEDLVPKVMRHMRRRTAITGIGCVTPLALDARSSWEYLKSGKSGIDAISSFDTEEFSCKVIGAVKGFRPRAGELDGLSHHRLPRAVQFLLSAVEEALRDSGLQPGSFDPSTAGVSMGESVNCFDIHELGLVQDTSLDVGDFFPRMMSSAAFPALRYGLRGPNLTTDTACAAGLQATGKAFRIIERGDADLMVAGGCSSPTNLFGVASFANLNALSRANISRPFDAKRDGMILAEGAGVVILEEMSRAVKRGAKIYGEVMGYASTANADRITDSPPDAEAEALAMKLALEDGGLNARAVDCICAHGTSTRQNDRTETLAIKKVFGDHSYRLAVNSNKAQIGHTIAAAGVLNLVFTLLGMEEGLASPTMNYVNRDPNCDLDYVPNEARRMAIRTAMVNAFGFGGHNASLVVKSL